MFEKIIVNIMEKVSWFQLVNYVVGGWYVTWKGKRWWTFHFAIPLLSSHSVSFNEAKTVRDGNRQPTNIEHNENYWSHFHLSRHEMKLCFTGSWFNYFIIRVQWSVNGSILSIKFVYLSSPSRQFSFLASSLQTSENASCASWCNILSLLWKIQCAKIRFCRKIVCQSTGESTV